MTLVRYERAAATSPGKHGPGDWRVTFNGAAPTHGEIVFLVGMVLIAEDRYRAQGGMGRTMLWYFLDRLWSRKAPADVIDLAGECDGTKLNPPRKEAM